MIKFLVWDYGSFVEQALRLADGGKNHVYYFTPWARSNSSKFESYSPGLGFENDGMEKIFYFADYIDKADCIVFFDKGAGDIADYLKKTTNKPVFAAGEAERIENDRELLASLEKRVGLQVPARVKIKGIAALKRYLEPLKDKYVKINIFRGDLETCHFTNYEAFKPVLDRLEVDMGAFGDYYDFFVEDPIPGKEPGFDAFFTNGQYVKPFSYGYALENWINIGKFVNELPKPLQDVADKLRPILKVYDYRGQVGTEVRTTEGAKNYYLTDLTTRLSTPVSMAYPVVIKNYPELIYNLARKKDTKIDLAGKYFIMLPLASEPNKKNWIKLDFDPKYRKFVKSPSIIKINGSYYSTRGADFAYTLVSYGDSMEQCITMMKNLADKVDGWGVDKTVVDGLDKIKEFLKDTSKYGLGEF